MLTDESCFLHAGSVDAAEPAPQTAHVLGSSLRAHPIGSYKPRQQLVNDYKRLLFAYDCCGAALRAVTRMASGQCWNLELSSADEASIRVAAPLRWGEKVLEENWGAASLFAFEVIPVVLREAFCYALLL